MHPAIEAILAERGVVTTAEYPRLKSSLNRGRVLFPAVRFRGWLLVLEFDGRDTHLAAAQFLADRERANLLEAAGYHVLRFGWERLDQPDYIVATVRQGLRIAPLAR